MPTSKEDFVYQAKTRTIYHSFIKKNRHKHIALTSRLNKTYRLFCEQAPKMRNSQQEPNSHRIIKIFAKTEQRFFAFYKKLYFWKTIMKDNRSTYHSSITTQSRVALSVTTTFTVTTTTP
jgi:hypothetical protein